jgi:hypothetical protein
MLSRSLAPDVAATLIETKIMAAPKDEGEEAIQSALIRMFSNALSGPLLMKASKRALGCQNTRRRIQTLACLLPRLPLEAKIEFLSLMVRDVAKMAGVDGSDSRLQAALFKQIAPHLEEAVLDVAKAAVELLASDETGHRRALEALAPALARLGHGHEALEIVRACAAIDAYEGSPRANLFKQIVPHLEEAVLDEAKAVVESLTSSEEGYMEALAALALQLARLGRGHDALEAVRAIDWEWKRGEALAAVIPHLPSPLLPTARELLDDLGFKPGSTVRRASVVAIVKRCPDHEMTTLLSEALAAIATPDAWNAEHDYTDSLPVLTSRLTPSIVHGAIVLVRERSDGALALAILAGCYPNPSEARYSQRQWPPPSKSMIRMIVRKP